MRAVTVAACQYLAAGKALQLMLPTNIFDRDTFAEYLGIELTSIAQGQAVATLEVAPHHCNSYGMVHGGAIFALADAVFAAASNSHGRVAVAIEANISYFKAVTTGTLTAVANELSRSRKLATYEIRIVDDTNELVAQFTGTVYRKSDTVEDVLDR